MYRFPWYLTLVSTNHASSNPGQKVSGIGLIKQKSLHFLVIKPVCPANFLFIKQETWYFLLDKKNLAPFSFNKQVNCAY